MNINKKIETFSKYIIKKPLILTALMLTPLILGSTILYFNLNRISKNNLIKQKDLMIEHKKEEIIREMRARVESAYSTIEHYYTEQLGQEACKETLSKLTFGDNNYIWVHQPDKEHIERAYMVVHPEKKLVGKHLSALIDLDKIDNIYLHGKVYPKNSREVQHIKPTDIFTSIYEKCVDQGYAVVPYYWSKIVDGVAGDIGYLKVSYVKYFPEWNWVIGAGAYADHIENEVDMELAQIEKSNQNTWQLIGYSFFFIGIGVAFLTFIAFKTFSTNLTKHEQDILEGQKRLAEEVEKVTENREHLLQVKDDLEKSNNELRTSKEQYSIVVENISMGIALISPEMRLLSINEQVKEWFPNIDITQHPICYQSMYDIDQEEACIGCPVSEAFEDGQRHQDVITRHLNNTTYHFRLTANPVVNDEGEVVAVIEILDDITQQRTTENALKDSEKKYRGLHESIMDAIGYFDLKGHITECNHVFEKMLGYTEDELKLKTFSDITPEKWHQQEADIIQTEVFKEGYSKLYDKELIHKNGTIIAVELRTFLIKDEFGPTGMWAIIRDVTDRKEAEERASRNEQFFRTLIANMPQRVLLKDKQSRFIYCNQQYADYLNLSIDEVIGKTDFDLYPDDVAKKYIANDQEVIESDKTVELISRYLHDGQEGITRVVKTTVRGESGEIEGLLCVFEDFTERIKMEEGLKNANRELEETNKQLQDMQTQLVQSEKMASIGQLAAGVAHEINNPMGFVTSNFGTLKKYINKMVTMNEAYEQFLNAAQNNDSINIKEEISKISDMKEDTQIEYIMEDIDEIFEESSEGISRVINIVKNLRDFSRIDQVEDLADTNLVECINSTLVVAKNELKYATDVITDLPEKVDVYCNSGQLNQVFLNILVNAAQAIDNQEREDKGNIQIKVFSEPGFAVCQISDDGPGISQENLSKIFDPFFTTKPVGKGTGLGLNLSYDIVVNKHKGQLLVDSELDKGTTFTIKIPENLKELLEKSENETSESVEDVPVC